MTQTLAAIIWALGAVAWYVLRYPHERKARKTRVRHSRRDLREIVLMTISLTGLGIVPFAYVLTGFGGFADYSFSPVQGWIGAVLFAGALWLFHRTHSDLGRNWSVSLEVRDQHRLVTDGVYRHVRHPMYSAFFLWALAQIFLLPNFIAGPAGLIGFGTLFLFRVGREEAMMREAFGEEYDRYAARTGRIVPWLL
jgi:protein-S-isoprenylcysteine O-methyltransferase Ste14